MFGFKRNRIESESGVFYLQDGIVTDFRPSGNNPFTEEIFEEPQANHGHITKKSIRHLIVPKGVRGFADDFFRGITITERFELPDGLLYLGNSYHDKLSHGCVFAKTTIPAVNIPETVTEIGEFAWGGSQIGILRIPASIHSQTQYLRQFKDATIQTLCLPEEWEEHFYLEGTQVREKFSYEGQCSNQFGWLGLDATVYTLVFGKAQLAGEYNKRRALTYSNPCDEQWFKAAMQILSNDVFTCYGKGHHLYQEKECEWGMIYQLLTEIKGVDATIRLKVAKEDFEGIAAEYRNYQIVKEAIANGWISIMASLMTDKSIQLYCFLDWDIGDSENFGRWTINLMAFLDKTGKFIKPFFVQDSRMR